MTLKIERFERNTRGRDLIVGDIHGCFSKLQSALDEVGFSPDAGDRLFSVGDLVDRGPESKLALEWLQRPWFHAVQGNHEDMAIRWGKPDCRMDPGNYAANGGAWNIANTPEERAEFSLAFADLPLAIEIETALGTVGLVHADCPFVSWTDFRAAIEGSASLTSANRKAIRQTAMWDRSRIEGGDLSGVADVLAVVVGHTPLNRMVMLGNVCHIDTAGWHPDGCGFTIIDAATLDRAYRAVPGEAA